MVVNQHIPHIGSSHPAASQMVNPGFIMFQGTKGPWMFWAKTSGVSQIFVIQKAQFEKKNPPKRGADRWPCPAESWHQPAQWSLLACPGEPENLGTFLWRGQYPI